MKQLHPIQQSIVKKLAYSNGLRYTEIKENKELENNIFDFHLDKMIDQGYVLKTDKIYILTDKGKELSASLEYSSESSIMHPKTIVSVCCKRKTKMGWEYLIQTRIKQPFYGCQEFPSGKVKFGESVIDGAKRELKEETNLEGMPRVVSIKHYLVSKNNSDVLIEDFYIFLCLATNPKGELKSNAEGKCEWVLSKDLKTNVTNHIEGLEAFMEQIKVVETFKGQPKFEEIIYKGDNF